MGPTPLKATLQAPAFTTGDVELPAAQISAARALSTQPDPQRLVLDPPPKFTVVVGM